MLQVLYPSREVRLQRLFTTFANSWPGIGLLVQRLVTGIALLYRAVVLFNGTPATTQIAQHMAGAVFGLFILAGLWTPVAGTLVALVEFWIVLSGGGNAWISIILAVLGGTLAMIGPGAWSIDARLFGRKHIPT